MATKFSQRLNAGDKDSQQKKIEIAARNRFNAGIERMHENIAKIKREIASMKDKLEFSSVEDLILSQKFIEMDIDSAAALLIQEFDKQNVISQKILFLQEDLQTHLSFLEKMQEMRKEFFE